MRILLLTLNYLPELTGIGKYSGEMAEWLAAHGHSVRVVTTPPYYPEWKIHSGYSAWKYACEQRANVNILRCPLWVPRHQSGFARILNLASFAVFSLPALIVRALKFHPDIIGVIKPPMFALPAGLIAARLTGARAWVHIQDFEIDVAFEMGILKGRGLATSALRLEAAMLKRFDLATTISPRMCERLIAKGVNENKTQLFPNWVDCELIKPLMDISIFRSKLSIRRDQVVVLYAGNMGEKQGLDTLVHAANVLRDNPQIVMVLAGEGTVRRELERKLVGYSNIRFLPLQPLEHLNQLLNLADIHVLPQRADAADLVMPSKLSGMLASGKPIVAGAHPGTQVAHEVEGAGLVIPPDDGVAMANAIRQLTDNPMLRHQLGAEARKRALFHWERETVLKRMEKGLLDLIRGPKMGT